MPSLTPPPPVHTLTADDARRIVLRAQGVLGAQERRSGVYGVLGRLGAVQLDTISTLARSHELVPYARLGAVGRAAVERAYWANGVAFEYWSHAACVLPMSSWPHFAFRRRRYRDRGHLWGHQVSAEAYRAVVDRLRAEGPLTATELGGAKNKGEWWDWSDTKIAVERALAFGDVVCVRRTGWKRVYDLAERAVPGDLFARDPDDADCVRELVDLAGRQLGVATTADLMDQYRLTRAQVETALPHTPLVPVAVEGWADAHGRRTAAGPRRAASHGSPPVAAWAHPAALASAPKGRHRTTLLSPFDSLVWDRPRTARVFGFTHRLEAYVPKAKREHGYFVMPLLAGGRLLGRVDPAREGRTLVARQLSFEVAPGSARVADKTLAAMADALREAATWVGCDSVRLEKVTPEPARIPLAALLA
ncbi:winged helix DNA-binding domain-containing protein [Yinghuangia sp. ASG 101]|uniref:winged helix-turn-helix domain-containing protein n=1 Tax=Yinghuangia sp. ASG 101 TaxID=2896848 RepID=UPI001E64EF55|nr:crosslink repair DNA glycosylase YcaQ family protein [Yinghuangia sp. ASG 101]UGQ09563.1 winged helix DNA-binding domain-containing protein [Yinghuangia sp. ASG 101]